MSILAAVTRFNDKTYKENCDYRAKNGMLGCCYGTPVLLPEHTPIGSIVYVLEMNNETNKIMGIGMIRNHNRADKRYNIYSDGNYNRHNYRSEYRIDRVELVEYDKQFVEIMEILVFKGYTHMKRGHGITLITDKKYKELKQTKTDILSTISDMFIHKYRKANFNNANCDS